MLMPYLADHLSGGLGLVGWLVGLILGVRNFSQQGMFLVGGSLADRFGYKPMIVAGCALRTGGFALLGLVDAVPALFVASAATGFAGALFNPAVRAYISPRRRGPPSRGVRAVQRLLPGRDPLGPVGRAAADRDRLLGHLPGRRDGVRACSPSCRSGPCRRAGARTTPATGNAHRSCASGVRWPQPEAFLLFSVAMIGSYVLTFQVYLALPLQARSLLGGGEPSTVLVAGVFVVSGGVTIAAR